MSTSNSIWLGLVTNGVLGTEKPEIRPCRCSSLIDVCAVYCISSVSLAVNNYFLSFIFGEKHKILHFFMCLLFVFFSVSIVYTSRMPTYFTCWLYNSTVWPPSCLSVDMHVIIQNTFGEFCGRVQYLGHVRRRILSRGSD